MLIRGSIKFIAEIYGLSRKKRTQIIIINIHIFHIDLITATQSDIHHMLALFI